MFTSLLNRATPRMLMGPGPSDVPASVLETIALAPVGHLDPAFITVMDEIRDMLRAAFETENRLTFPVSGTGSAGMQTVFANLIEPGDRVCVVENGVFGGRMAEVARRLGADVQTVSIPWGETITPDALAAALDGRPTALVALVQAETSTGAHQDLTGMRAVCDAVGALLVVDAVTSLAGTSVRVDHFGIDAVYAGTQKCLSVPPGLAPVSLSARAEARMAARKTPVSSWYLDVSLLANYWGGRRAYHHTAPVNMLAGLHEGLRLVLGEGLDARHERHARIGRALTAGLTAMGLELPVAPGVRLPQLTVVRIPDGVDDKAVRQKLLADKNLEIGGGLGAFAGNVWRIGTMGASATPQHVTTLLRALAAALKAQGHIVPTDGVAAAQDVLARG